MILLQPIRDNYISLYFYILHLVVINFKFSFISIFSLCVYLWSICFIFIICFISSLVYFLLFCLLIFQIIFSMQSTLLSQKKIIIILLFPHMIVFMHFKTKVNLL